MNVCIVYDCLFPWTVGGAERWYRNVGERLAAEGYDVTYVTLRQWPRREPPLVPGVAVLAVGPRVRLYNAGGRRRLTPPLVFGIGALGHLVRHGRRYDVVHTACFPYFSLLAAAVARRLHGFVLVVDWHEFWTRTYWQEYAGRLAGSIGWLVQGVCARVPQKAFAFSEVHARRLPSSAGPVTVLRGQYAGPHAGDQAVRQPLPPAQPPQAVSAGRHTIEKRVPSLVAAVAAARAEVPDLVLHVFGDGPEHGLVRREARDAEWVRLFGFVDVEEVEGALAGAACLVLASVREGYGLVVVEALAHGCPAVVVRHPDNAAVELVEEGVNGTVAHSGSPEDLGAAIARAVLGGEALRRSTARWYAAHAHELALEASLDTVVASYSEWRPAHLPTKAP